MYKSKIKKKFSTGGHCSEVPFLNPPPTHTHGEEKVPHKKGYHKKSN